MFTVREYVDSWGGSPFGKWFDGLDSSVAARISIVLSRMEQGNLSNAKVIGSGVSEYKIDSGPGYRIYFGWEGEEIIVLLGGGKKDRQQKDIVRAIETWLEYLERKKVED